MAEKKEEEEVAEEKEEEERRVHFTATLLTRSMVCLGRSSLAWRRTEGLRSSTVGKSSLHMYTLPSVCYSSTSVYHCPTGMMAH